MNWKLKAHALAVLSRLPAGSRLYHALQGWLRTDSTTAEEYIARATEIVELVREAGRDPCQGTYLEIGTGWKPYLPFLLYLIGAERIITIDVNPWLNDAYTIQTFEAITQRIPSIAQRLGLDAERLQGRADRVADQAKSREALLAACGIEYRYPADAARTQLADNSVDVVCSSNVLEHVVPKDLRAIHDESLRILKPGGLAVHRFNPQDHYSTCDRSITGANFLRYSRRQWSWYGGRGLGYHNRLRCVQHRRLLEASGFQIVIERVRTDQRSLEALQRGELVVHPDFDAFAPEELAADYMWCVGLKPQPSLGFEANRADESAPRVSVQSMVL